MGDIDISREAVENICRGFILIGGEQVQPFVEMAMALRAALDAAEARAVGVREKAEVACQIEIDRGDRNAQSRYAAGARACRDAIRAIPTTFTDAELLAAAAELPKVKALVEAASAIKHRRENGDCGSVNAAAAVDALSAALAPFTRKGE